MVSDELLRKSFQKTLDFQKQLRNFTFFNILLLFSGESSKPVFYSLTPNPGLETGK